MLAFDNPVCSFQLWGVIKQGYRCKGNSSDISHALSRDNSNQTSVLCGRELTTSCLCLLKNFV